MECAAHRMPDERIMDHRGWLRGGAEGDRLRHRRRVMAMHQRRSRFLILHNPMAGRNGEGLVHDVAGALRQQGMQVESCILGVGSDTGKDLAHRYDAVVISGGDGSIRAMAERTATENVPLGIIPNGTGNVLAQEFGLPRTPAELAKILIEGRAVPVQGGTVNGSAYLLMFGAGFDGRVVGRLSRRLVQRLGKLAYAWPILRSIAETPVAFEAMLDGQLFVTSWLLITNASRYGGRFHLTSRTRVTDKSLVAFVSHAQLRRERLAELLHLIRGRLESATTIQVMAVNRAEILNPEVPGQIDGEPLAGGGYILEPRHDASMIIASIEAEGSKGTA